METTATLKAQPREAKGTKAARRLRNQGKLPAIIYGHGQKPVSVAIDAHDFDQHLHHGEHVLSVDVGGKTESFLIKAVQYDHLDTTPIHVDLARVDLNERVVVKVAIELRGTPKGLSEGGLMDQVMPDVEIECLVTEIPEVIRPNVSHLGVDESLTVKDLELPPSAKPIADLNAPVATIRPLATAEATEEEAEDQEGAAEPEVIGRGKEEESTES